MRLSVPRYEGAIGLPEGGQAITITNTERADAACPRRWWFRHGERMSSPPYPEQRHGSAWHSILEDVHRWWAARDVAYPPDGLDACVWCTGPRAVGPTPCPACAGSGLGPLARHGRDLRVSVRGDIQTFTLDDVADAVETLRRCADGWFRRYGWTPYRDYRVAAVEIGISRVILNPRTGHPYRPETYLVEEPGGRMRLASTGEISGAVPLPAGCVSRVVSWPWYQVGRLDAVLVHRSTGAVYVGEWKSSGDPRGLIEGLSVDPQTSGYVWLLEGAASAGQIAGGREVVGYLYDVASSSYHYDAEPLAPVKVPVLGSDGQPVMKGRSKVYEVGPDGEPITRSPGLSRSKSRTVPSWRFEEAIRRHGFDRRDYADHLAHLVATTDPRLYVREWAPVGPEEIARYTEEVYADAVRFAGYRRAAARAEDATDLNIAFPRVAVCRLPGGRCAFRGPCVADGEHAREGFEVGAGPVWTPDPEAMKQGVISWR